MCGTLLNTYHDTLWDNWLNTQPVGFSKVAFQLVFDLPYNSGMPAIYPITTMHNNRFFET